MRTKQEALDKFGDEICGMLLEAFAEAEARYRARSDRPHEDEANMGRSMLRRMRRGKEFIEQVWEFLNEPKKEIPNGTGDAGIGVRKVEARAAPNQSTPAPANRSGPGKV